MTDTKLLNKARQYAKKALKIQRQKVKTREDVQKRWIRAEECLIKSETYFLATRYAV